MREAEIDDWRRTKPETAHNFASGDNFASGFYVNANASASALK